MTTADALRYLAAVFFVWRMRSVASMLRSDAMKWQYGDADDRAAVVDRYRTIVARWDARREPYAEPRTKWDNRVADIWRRALREVETAS